MGRKKKYHGNGNYNQNFWASLTEKEKIEYHLKKRYGLTYSKWIEMFELQNYKCYLCNSPIEAEYGNSINKGVVDHNHETKVIRKILCHDCNRALGLLKENKETIIRILDYL